MRTAGKILAMTVTITVAVMAIGLLEAWLALWLLITALSWSQGVTG